MISGLGVFLSFSVLLILTPQTFELNPSLRFVFQVHHQADQGWQAGTGDGAACRQGQGLHRPFQAQVTPETVPFAALQGRALNGLRLLVQDGTKAGQCERD
jgi:hypothetical protein